MSKEYEMAFRMNAELDAKFSRVFTNASDKIGQLERQLSKVDHIGSSGGFGRGIISGLASIGKAGALAVGVGVAGGVVAAGYAIKSSLEKAMDFESELSTIQALTGASSDEMSKMQALALKEGAATKYSALEAAQGIEELLKSGLKPAAVQAGALDAALNLATAGGLDLAEAASTMSTSMNAFKKDGMTAAQVSNILAGTANAAATDVHEIGYAIAQAGSVADMAGLSFLDLNTAVGLMSNDGLKSGSDAGTSFKSMLMYLQPQTKKATALFNQLGIGVGKSNKFFSKGKIKDIAGIADVLKKAFGGMSEQDMTAKMMEMFGTDGVKAATSLFKAGAEGVKEFQHDMSDVTALEVARKKMDNAAGSVEQFKGALETLQIAGLMPTMPLIKELADTATNYIVKYTPQITAGIQNMVDTSKAYLKEHFIDNPEFQKLTTFESKVAFVFDDVEKSFNAWWSASGHTSFKGYSDQITSTIMSTLEGSVPEITKIGVKIGSGLAAGMYQGLLDSKSVGWLFKGLTPKPIRDLIVGGDSDSGSGGSTPKKQETVFDIVNPGQKLPETLRNILHFPGTPDAPVGFRANGGIVTQPELSWIGEGRYSEAIIPLNKSNRSQSLWETAGRMIGAKPAGSGSAGGGNFHFNPTYNFYGNADQSAVQQMEQRTRSDFAKEFSAWKQQQRRVSMGV